MDNVFITGLFGLFCALIGVGGGFAINLVLRKEKFKEIVYKEQLLVHKEIAEARGKILTLFSESLKDRKKVDELAAEAVRVGDIFRRHSLLVSDEVRKSTGDFVMAAVDPFIVRKKDKEVIDDSKAESVIVYEKYHAATNVAREELGIEPLSESIAKTFKF